MPLEEYRAKRDFSHTPEPVSGEPTGDVLSFVVQKHHARALHYDFRLELDGVLMSWAVPKGPSLDTRDKRLAVHVEDHPLDYGGFEGTIPAGEYGGGTVIVWDRGTWEPHGDPHEGLAKGDFKFTLHGEKLRGLWVLVRLKPRPGEKRDNWLLIKEKDEYVRPREEYDVIAEEPDSVLGAPSDGGSAGRVSGDEFSDKGPDPESAGAPASIAADPPGRPASVGVKPEAATPSAGATPAPFPSAVDLQLATLVDTPPEGDEWLAEVKYDGYRVALTLEGGRSHAATPTGASASPD